VESPFPYTTSSKNPSHFRKRSKLPKQRNKGTSDPHSHTESYAIQIYEKGLCRLHACRRRGLVVATTSSSLPAARGGNWDHGLRGMAIDGWIREGVMPIACLALRRR